MGKLSSCVSSETYLLSGRSINAILVGVRAPKSQSYCAILLEPNLLSSNRQKGSTCILFPAS